MPERTSPTPVSSPSLPKTPALSRWERRGLWLFLALVLVFGVLVEKRSAFMQRRMGDLGVFLRTAWAVRSGEDIYSVTDSNGFHYHYPPLFAILMAPLADPGPGVPRQLTLPYPVLVAICYLLSLGCLVFAVHGLACVLEQGSRNAAIRSQPAGCRRWWLIRVVPVLGCLPPVGHTLMRGQVGLLLLLLVCGFITTLVRGRRFRAGLWLAGAICLKVIPAYLLVQPLWRRDWRTPSACAAGLMVGLILVPTAVFGPARTRAYYEEWLHVLIEPAFGAGNDQSRAKELLEVTATDSQSFLAVCHNTLYPNRDTRPHHVSAAVSRFHWALVGVMTIVTLLLVRGRKDAAAQVISWGQLTLLMILASPVCHLHYFCLSIPLVMGWLAARWEDEPDPRLGVGALTVLALNFIANSLPHFPGLELTRDCGSATYAALMLWGVGAWELRRRASARTETAWQRLFVGTRSLRERPEWADFAGDRWADQIMTIAVNERRHTKQGRAIARWVLRARGRELVVYLKRHYVLPRWRGLLATIRPRRAWSPGLQEWNHLEWARRQRMPVPIPAAAGEFVGPWGRLRSFIAVVELRDMVPLHEAVRVAAALPPPTFQAWKRGLIAEMARIVRELHDRRHFHKDLYLCHFYIACEDTQRVPDWRGRVHLIDLHRLGYHPWTPIRWLTKDLGQLLFSSELAGITARDRLRFWRQYRTGTRALGPWVRRWIELRAWSYGRHERRRLARAAAGHNVEAPPRESSAA